IVLDLVMPGLDGLSVLDEVRRRGSTPVILLSGMRSEADRIRGLDHGADDYLVKPFSLGELEARVRAVLRRAPSDPAPAPDAAPAPHDTQPVRAFGTLEIDRNARQVRLAGELVPLTRREFDLLAFLADHPRRVVGLPELLEQVWQSSVEWQDPNTVKEHIRRLRLKVEADPSSPRLLRTVRGAGFLFEPDGAPTAAPV
ncbi:MAG TPA: response regulator transcription factor, partial [Acidimicrobiales bacterium]|nr:response regulator transcription factor [Acidimicrobiales bacterium]